MLHVFMVSWDIRYINDRRQIFVKDSYINKNIVRQTTYLHKIETTRMRIGKTFWVLVFMDMKL